MNQVEDIFKIYNEQFNDIQREAFLLGRISALIQFGQTMSDAANNAIKDSENLLGNVQKVLRGEVEEEKPKKTTRKRSTKKEAKKDE